MSRIIKLCGMLAFFVSSAAFGFYKAYMLQKRLKLLEKIYSSAIKLKEHIKYGESEINILIQKCFSQCDAIEFSSKGIIIEAPLLLKEDTEFLQEMFLNLGKGYSEEECKRLELFVSLLSTKIKELREETAGKAKLWKTGGISVGLAVCILLF